MLALMGKLETPYPDSKKLILLHNNLKHEIKSFLWAKSYRTVDDFIQQAINAEETINSKARYKPPPAPEHSLLPAMAYRPPKGENLGSKAKPIEKPMSEINAHSLAIAVAAILQETVLGVREIKTGKDARAEHNDESENGSTSGSDHGYNKPRTNYRRNSYHSNRGNRRQFTPGETKPESKSQEDNTNSSQKKENWRSKQNAGNKTFTNSMYDRLPKSPCPNFGKNGHWRRDCPEPIVLKCYNCGEPDVYFKDCTKCNPKQKSSLNPNGKA